MPAHTAKNVDMRAELGQLLKLPWEQCFARLVSWLLGRSARHRELAIQILVRNGKASVSDLLRAAFAPRRPQQHRVRLLQVVEKIGQPLELNQFFDLLAMMERYGPAVQYQISRVLLAHHRAVSNATPLALTNPPSPPPVR